MFHNHNKYHHFEIIPALTAGQTKVKMARVSINLLGIDIDVALLPSYSFCPDPATAGRP